MFIPGFLISIITFPGVVVHELAHQFSCYLCGLKVYEVKYFRIGNPSGYVIHETSDHPGKVFLTSMGPFFGNTLVGTLFILLASIQVVIIGEYNSFLSNILVWLGFSILMHAFPSSGDAKVMFNQILKNDKVGIGPKILSAPIILLVYVGAIGSIFWLDAIYALAITSFFIL